MVERESAAASDGELAGRYARGDQAAFRLLVERHAGPVHAVCRRVLGEAHGAEDAAQAVFLLLARKAYWLGGKGSLAGWLFRAAERTAWNARTARARRQQHEREAAQMREEKAREAEAAWTAVAGELDHALAGLPRGQRAAVVLRYLYGRAEKEVAGELGLSRGAVAQRLQRALAGLRKRLGRRGVAVPAALLAALLAERAAQAAPAGLSAGIQAAGLGAAPASAAAVTMMEATMKAMRLLKAKLAGAVAAAALVAGAVAPAILAPANGQGEPDPTPAPAAATAAPPAVSPAATSAPPAEVSRVEAASTPATPADASAPDLGRAVAREWLAAVRGGDVERALALSRIPFGWDEQRLASAADLRARLAAPGGEWREAAREQGPEQLWEVCQGPIPVRHGRHSFRLGERNLVLAVELGDEQRVAGFDFWQPQEAQSYSTPLAFTPAHQFLRAVNLVEQFCRTTQPGRRFLPLAEAASLTPGNLRAEFANLGVLPQAPYRAFGYAFDFTLDAAGGGYRCRAVPDDGQAVHYFTDETGVIRFARGREADGRSLPASPALRLESGRTLVSRWLAALRDGDAGRALALSRAPFCWDGEILPGNADLRARLADAGGEWREAAGEPTARVFAEGDYGDFICHGLYWCRLGNRDLSVAVELGEGERVVGFCPLSERALNDLGRGAPRGALEALNLAQHYYRAINPDGRFGSPEELAAAVPEFLCDLGLPAARRLPEYLALLEKTGWTINFELGGEGNSYRCRVERVSCEPNGTSYFTDSSRVIRSAQGRPADETSRSVFPPDGPPGG